MPQVALHEREGACELLRQRTVDVFAVQIARIVQHRAGEGHRLDHERGAEALRTLREEHHAGQVELFAVAQADVLQHLIDGLVVGVKSPAIPFLEVGGERLGIEIGRQAAGHRHHVRKHQPRALKHPLKLLAGGDVPLVSALLHPDAPSVVHVRLGKTIGHRHHDHKAT